MGGASIFSLFYGSPKPKYTNAYWLMKNDANTHKQDARASRYKYGAAELFLPKKIPDRDK